MDSMPPHPGPSQPPPQPPQPNVNHLELQAADLQQQIKTLQEQILQSETNLTAQWTVLQQNQRTQVEEAIVKAMEEKLEKDAKKLKVALSHFDGLLQPIMETCTKDSISSGKSWMFQQATDKESEFLLAEYLCLKVTNQNTKFNQKLHIIYLVNDVLHHCVRKGNSGMQTALESVVVPMYCSTAKVAGSDEMEKLSKLISLWTSKNKFFAEETLEAMKNPGNSFNKYKADLAEKYRSKVEEVEKQISTTYGGYKQQHEQFVDHAASNIDKQLQPKLDQLQQQIQEIRGSSGKPASSGRKSRWDRQALPDQSNNTDKTPVPGMPLVDLSRPPPGFSFPGPVEPERPSAPYYDLPAGLMVSMVRLEDSGYTRPLDPDHIRLPPPQPPSERLRAAVELFYSAPSHDRPRDTEVL